MADIPWAQPSNPDFVGQANAGALAGVDTIQKLQAAHALQGVDFNDPGSLDNAITGLTRAGATDHATALMNLTTARMVRSKLLPDLIAKLSPTPAAPTTAAPTDAQPAPADPHADATAHANDTMAAARQGVQTLMNTPIDQRPQVFGQIKQQLVERGVPEQAVDAAGEDLSDAGLQKYGAYLDAHNGAVNPAQGQAPGQMPDHPTGYEWAKGILQDPTLNNPVTQGLLKTYAGIDVAPSIERAERIMQPTINKQADVAAAGPTEAARQSAITGALPEQEAIKAAAKGAGAKAEKEAEVPYTDVTMNIGGKDVHGTMHVMDGKTIFVPTTEAGSGSAAEGLTPGQKDFQTAQAKAVNDTINRDQAERTTAMTDRDNALKQLTIASSMKFDPAVPNLAAGANMFRALPMPVQESGARVRGTTPDKIEKYAGEAALYNQGSKTLIGQFMKTAGPARYTEQELKFFTPVIGSLHDPNDAAKFMDALQVSIANKKIARADYANDPNTVASVKSNPSAQVYESGWAASTAGRAAIMEDPVWQKTIIAGKPAVERFTARDGKPYLAVLPGLGKPTIIPVR